MLPLSSFRTAVLRIGALVCVCGLLALAISGCGPASSHTVGNNNGDGGIHPDGWVNPCQGYSNQVVCDGNAMVTCGPSGQEVDRQDCGSLICVGGAGCVLCAQGDSHCQGNTVMVCGDDLMHWEQGVTCDPNAGDFCDPDEGTCVNLCDKAAENRANVGCDYIAVDMGNVDEYNANNSCYVVIVSNVQPEGTAVVTVEDMNGQVLDFPGLGTEIHIAPGELAILPITGNTGECTLTPARPNATTMTSGLQGSSAFRVRSSLPVVAYQINPYEAALKHTTDASLLIPTPALGLQYVTANYMGLNRMGMYYAASISIVAVEDNTTVTVVPSVTLQPDGGGLVPASGQFAVTLNSMEHLQILSQDYLDLTNTLITADLPVAVFSGDLCSDVPMGMGYCDHLEEQMPPVNSWGSVYVAARPPRRAQEGAFWRVIAALDGTQIFVEPYSQYNQTMNRGDIVEIDEQESFLIETASNSPDPDAEPPPILVVNYLKGAEQTALESGTDIWSLGNLRGDPAMTLSVPVEQYLNSYIFLSDTTYAYNYVVVVRTDSTQPVHLDCFDPIPEDRFVAVSGTYQRAQVTLSAEDNSQDGTCAAGVHRIWSDAPFGIWVYGYFSDTSYGYPGGMNLEQINDVIIVE